MINREPYSVRELTGLDEVGLEVAYKAAQSLTDKPVVVVAFKGEDTVVQELDGLVQWTEDNFGHETGMAETLRGWRDTVDDPKQWIPIFSTLEETTVCVLCPMSSLPGNC